MIAPESFIKRSSLLIILNQDFDLEWNQYNIMLKNAAFRLNQNKLCNQSRHFDGKRLVKCYLIFKFSSMFGQSVAILLLKSALHRNDNDRPKCAKFDVGKIEPSIELPSQQHWQNNESEAKTR